MTFEEKMQEAIQYLKAGAANYKKGHYKHAKNQFQIAYEYHKTVKDNSPDDAITGEVELGWNRNMEMMSELIQRCESRIESQGTVEKVEDLAKKINDDFDPLGFGGGQAEPVRPEDFDKPDFSGSEGSDSSDSVSMDAESGSSLDIDVFSDRLDFMESELRRSEEDVKMLYQKLQGVDDRIIDRVQTVRFMNESEDVVEVEAKCDTAADRTSIDTSMIKEKLDLPVSREKRFRSSSGKTVRELVFVDIGFKGRVFGGVEVNHADRVGNDLRYPAIIGMDVLGDTDYTEVSERG